MKTGKQILEGLFEDQRAAAHDPHHPVNDQLRASLLLKKHLLELIHVPRHQLKSDDSYVLVADIPEYFKTEFEQYFLGQNLLQHLDNPDVSRLDSKRLDSFISYLKDHPSYKSEQRGQA
ncbi:hypothetical protein [Acinetobacter baumannii]|uniref:hypothetical protein n=1 Tax=Acinetobacter baumannii TaxID=470 RepID=UPI001898ED89|nr:hypothetical protein [Acinetobacter baumannii]MBF6873178.1 hypothetical protein [Acinetobacter baumannii]